MINLQAEGYKIIGSNILQSMLNKVGRCTSCGEQKLQIGENVNKRIGMYESLVLFCLNCKKDIYAFNTISQVEKEKKNGMMDINLRSVAAVTSLGGYLTVPATDTFHRGGGGAIINNYTKLLNVFGDAL